jgi:hypothetical protein
VLSGTSVKVKLGGSTYVTSTEVRRKARNIGSDALGYSTSLGLGMSPHSVYRACINPLFYRALIAEFVGTALLLYFALTSAVYRGRAVQVDSIKIRVET